MSRLPAGTAKRFKSTRLLTKADMGPAEVRSFCQLLLSARGYYCVLKLARTIADLARVH